MWIEERQKQLMAYLAEYPEITVRALAQKLHVSEPTVRRDLTELDARGLVQKIHGGAVLRGGMADREIPFLLRENERSIAKAHIGRMASDYIEDGMVVMLDGSSSAYHLVPYLVGKKDLIVVTSGAKTAVSLAEANIRTFCTGGKMLIHSFSYVGEQAEQFVRSINADILFFSCHGLTDEGQMTDRAVEEANLRRAMFASCKKRILLCDSSKFGKTCFYNMGSVSEIDGIISEQALPPRVAQLMKKK
jgi:DeoR/GlpR family transcriptional regulator of sugar metabolism